MSGYIQYVDYTAGSNKGNVVQGQSFNNPFALGNVDPNYTSSKVEKNATAAASTSFWGFDWKPVIPGTVKVTMGGTDYVDDGNGVLYAASDVVEKVLSNGYTAQTAPSPFDPNYNPNTQPLYAAASVTVIVTLSTTAASVGTVVYDGDSAGVTFTAASDTAATIGYNYNNVIIPQNDLPILNAEIKGIPLLARARRIAIYYR